MTARFAPPVLEEIRRNLDQEYALSLPLLDAFAELETESAVADRDAFLSLATDARELGAKISQHTTEELPITIALVGDYSAGKSSLINDLLQDATLCPERDDPTTSQVTRFGYRQTERIVRVSHTGRITKLTRAQYAKEVQSSGRGRLQNRSRGFIVGTPNPLLRGIELLDTPGFNNLKNAGDTAVTEAALREVDAILFLVDVNSGTLPGSGMERLRKLKPLVPNAPIRVLFTKADQKAPGGLRNIKEECARRYGDLFSGDVLAYSTQQTGLRSDVMTREALATLFRQMSIEQRQNEARQLAERSRHHLRRRRQLFGRVKLHIESLFWAEQAKAKNAEQNKPRLLARFKSLQSDLAPVFQREVRIALRNGFLVREIKNTGFFFDDARIERASPTLSEALPAFSSVREIGERLNFEVQRIIRGATEDAQQTARATCVEASADCVSRANKLLDEYFGHLAGKKFDYESDASQYLNNLLGRHEHRIAEALWDEWVLWIDGLYEVLEEVHLVPTAVEAIRRAQELGELLDSYSSLLRDIAESRMELI